MKAKSDDYLLLFLLIISLNISLPTVQTLPIFSSSTSFITSLATKGGKTSVHHQITIGSDNDANTSMLPGLGMEEKIETTEVVLTPTMSASDSYTSSSSSIRSIETSNTHQCTEDEREDSDYNVPLERFAQLISTHWQFDHLDSIKSATYRLISEQFQKHISVSFKKNLQRQDHSHILLQHHFQQTNAPAADSGPASTNTAILGSSTTLSWDMMDLEILHAQIFGAVQAHTEGSLHLAWDRLADTLGQPALETHIREVTSKYCANNNAVSTPASSNETASEISNREVNDSTIRSSCLKANAAQISAELDDYVKDNLNKIFTALDDEVLPKLLADTSKDLTDVLAYFNRLFFGTKESHYTLHLEVTPWTSQQSTEGGLQANHILKMRLIPLFDHSISNDDHLLDFFSNYACLSKA